MKNKTLFLALSAIILCGIMLLSNSCKEKYSCTVSVVNNSADRVEGQIESTDILVKSTETKNYTIDLSKESEELWVWLHFINSSNVNYRQIGRNSTFVSGKKYTWTITNNSEALKEAK